MAFQKQHNTKSELIKGKKVAWPKIFLDFIKKLYMSIPDKVFKLGTKIRTSSNY